MVFEVFFAVVVLFILIISIRQIYEYERGILFTMGRYSRMLDPGWRIVLPIIQSMQKVDLRVKTVDVPSQETMTKDNVSARVNAVVYYKISDASKAIISVEDYMYAMSQLAQTTMRNVIGEVSLDELLSNREKVAERIMQIVDRESDPWGIKVTSVDLKDVEMPGEMKRVMAKGAEAERERRAVIIKAEGEVIAANNMAKAAKTLASADGALHLRTLQSINDLSSDQSNTIVFMVPLEVLRAIERLNVKK